MSQLPVFIMVKTQIAENIGATARAMMNCGIEELRLVAPRENHLSSKALSMAAGADDILRNAKIFPTLKDAVEDLNFVLATSARPRDMVYEVLNPEEAALKIHHCLHEKLQVGVLFGPERTGLLNDDLTFADAVIEIPANPLHSSLNVAQAVMVIGYEYCKNIPRGIKESLHMPASKPAEKHEIVALFEHLESELDNAGYFRIPEKRPRMVRNMRNIFSRAHLSLQEVNTLHGIINELVTLRLHPKKIYAKIAPDKKEKK